MIKKAEKIGGEIFYRVKYEDGDSEHMSVEDVEKYLAEDPHPPKARKTEKRAPQRGVSSGGDTMPDLEVVNVASGSQYQEALSNQQAIRIIDGQVGREFGYSTSFVSCNKQTKNGYRNYMYLACF